MWVRPTGREPDGDGAAPEHAYSDAKHGELRARITTELERVMAAAYG